MRELEEVAARATDEGLVARFGRKVLEVLPPIGSNKGTAVRHLLDGAGLHPRARRRRRHDGHRRVPRGRRPGERVFASR